jgi:epoxyqueuosine reductase QueG
LNLVENEEGPRIFLSTVLLEAPLSPLKKQGPVSLGLGEDRDKE